MLSRAGDLFLGRIAVAKRHRDKLPDNTLFHAIAVEPGLVRNDQIVLGVCVKLIDPRIIEERNR